jgi:hypothetical protein
VLLTRPAWQGCVFVLFPDVSTITVQFTPLLPIGKRGFVLRWPVHPQREEVTARPLNSHPPKKNNYAVGALHSSWPRPVYKIKSPIFLMGADAEEYFSFYSFYLSACYSNYTRHQGEIVQRHFMECTTWPQRRLSPRSFLQSTTNVSRLERNYDSLAAFL